MDLLKLLASIVLRTVQYSSVQYSCSVQ